MLLMFACVHPFLSIPILFLQTNMEREGGVGLYPPPTFHAVLLTYLIHRIEKADDRQPDICTDLVSTYLLTHIPTPQ